MEDIKCPLTESRNDKLKYHKIAYEALKFTLYTCLLTYTFLGIQSCFSYSNNARINEIRKVAIEEIYKSDQLKIQKEIKIENQIEARDHKLDSLESKLNGS
jgi:hypothetical protein